MSKPDYWNIAGIMTWIIFCSSASLDAGQQVNPKQEQAFETLLTNAVLTGHFSVDGKTDNATLAKSSPERYEIESVRKFQGDLWIFTARIKYGKTDLKIPLTLKVVWAEDTPMISMTNVKIPPLGTFTSRVFFYGNRYAGTWQHGEVGGHLWGKIEKSLPKTNQPPSEKKQND